MELINDLTKKHNIQYILSAIKSDLPLDVSGEIQEFKENEIILKLHDKDISGTLFGFEF